MSKEVEASVRATAFKCPNCHAFAAQYWYDVCGERKTDNGVPSLWTHEDAEMDVGDALRKYEDAVRENWRRLASGETYFSSGSAGSKYVRDIHNLYIAECFNCQKISLWVYDRLIWPSLTSNYIPASDLPEDCCIDFNEAAAIIDRSPRGAAALLRLCVQKLCKHLGGQGKNINDDIAMLVKNGLPEQIQQALDVVRVAGNNAVHPGEMNLQDNRDTAVSLFGLVNLIVDIMISQPKQVRNLFSRLPVGAIEAIEKRDRRV